jgi:hypothetical protein
MASTATARPAQPAERKALGLVVVGPIPAMGEILAAARPLSLGPQRQVAACPLSLSLPLCLESPAPQHTHTHTPHTEIEREREREREREFM